VTAEQAFRAVFSPPIVQRSLGVAIVVGTILNLINQGDVLLSRHAVVLWKGVLTYCVPFAVASYGSYTALRFQQRN
jgi:hypothetical protein